MKRCIVSIGLCMLLMVPLLPTHMATEAVVTHTIYMSGRYLTDFDRPWSIKYLNFWHFSLFRGDSSGNYVNFSFSHDTIVTLVVDNKPQLIQGPVDIYLGITEPGTFLMLWWPVLSLSGIGRAKIGGVVDTIQMTPIK